MNRNMHTTTQSKASRNGGRGFSPALFKGCTKLSTTKWLLIVLLIVSVVALPLLATADLSPPEPLKVVDVTPRGAHIAPDSEELVITFNQAVDIVSLGTVQLNGVGLNLTTAIWSAGDTVLTLALPSLDAASVYALSVEDFTSATGIAMAGAYTDQLVTATEDLDIAIIKRLRMPEDTVTPDTSFVFDVVPYSYNDDPAQSSELPALNISAIDFASSDTTASVGGMLDIYRRSEYLLQGVDFLLPGYYSYRISERTDTFTGSELETMIFDTKVWQVTFTVDRMPSPSPDTYVSAIDVQEVLEDDELGPKRELDDFIFVNSFIRSQDNAEPLIDSEGLSISKTVEGRLASRDLYFDFEVCVNAPDALSAHTGYKAYVVNIHTEDVVTNNDNGSIAGSTGYGDYLLFAPETTQTVSLKHDQMLIFTETHIGTRWNVTELATTDYIPSVTITRGGIAGAVVQGEVNTDLSTGDQQVSVGVNRADFVNELPTVPRTGLLIGSLHPLVVLAILLGIIALIVSAYRHRKEKELVVAPSLSFR